MSRRVASEKHALCFLGKCKPNQRRAILTKADKSLIEAISECIHNTLIGNVKLTQTQKAKLSRHKNTLRKLASKRVAWKSKKKLLLQTGGGFFSFLLPVVSTLLGSLFGSKQ